MRDIMRNLPGFLGHGEFYIVITCVAEKTYIFLSLKGLKLPIVMVMNMQKGGNFRYSKDI